MQDCFSPPTLFPQYDKYLNQCHCLSLCSYRMYINYRSQTMRGILKRKFAEVDDSPCYSSSSLSSPASSEWESDGESSSSDRQDFTPHSPSSLTSLPSESPKQRPQFFPPIFQIMQTSSLLGHFPFVFYRSVSYHRAAAML